MSGPERLTPEQEERLARYRAGALPPGERAAFEREIVASEALSEALYLEESLAVAAEEARALDPARATAPEVAQRRRVPRRTWSWAIPRIVLPAAAAVLIGIVVLSRIPPKPAPGSGGDVVRGVVARAEPLAPVGELSAAPRALVWTRDPGAAKYRVEWYAAGGAPLGTRVTPDTTLALESAAPDSGEWRVIPLGADGLERPAAPRAAWRVRAR